MKNILFLSFLMLLSFPVFAQKDAAGEILPPDKLELRTKLESDKSILELDCGRKQSLEALKENSRIKLILYRASLRDDKTAKAKWRCSSLEATPMVGYLLVENGKISYIADFSRDEFGGYKFEKYDCNKLTIGTYGLNDKRSTYVFTPLDNADLEGKTNLGLQCTTENREFVF